MFITINANNLRLFLAEQRESPHIERIDRGSRIVPLSYGRHMRGWHPVRPGHGAIAFESKLERDVIALIASYDEFLRIESQPLTVHYRQDGKRHRYTPDLFVSMTQVPDELAELGFGPRTYVEVKPYLRAIEVGEGLAHKFSAIEAATGCPTVLVTERDVSAIHGRVSHGD